MILCREYLRRFQQYLHLRINFNRVSLQYTYVCRTQSIKGMYLYVSIIEYMFNGLNTIYCICRLKQALRINTHAHILTHK